MQGESSKGIPSSQFDEYATQIQGAALNSTRHAVGLPHDLAFHRSIDSELAKGLDVFSARVLSITSRLLHLSSTVDVANGGGKGKNKLESQDDVMDSFHSLVVDSMDQMLERAVSGNTLLL
jgi:exosome complex exonuclease RRP6